MEPDKKGTKKINQKPNPLLVKKGKNSSIELVCPCLPAAGLCPGGAHNPTAERGKAVVLKQEVRDFTETTATNYKHEDSGIFREQPGKTKATFVLFNLKSCYFSQFQEN